MSCPLPPFSSSYVHLRKRARPLSAEEKLFGIAIRLSWPWHDVEHSHASVSKTQQSTKANQLTAGKDFLIRLQMLRKFKK